MPWRHIDFAHLARERLISETPPGPTFVANTDPTTSSPATHLDDAAPHCPAAVASYALVVDSDSVSIPATEERASFMGTSSQTGYEGDKFKRRESSIRTSRRRSLSVWLDALNSGRDEDAGGQDARCSSAAASREEATESASADTDTKQEDTTYVRQRRPS
ncbi:hypothetical protein T484DRAFT_1915289 [Baffinella frigidus]|nr:hypothetical protein T484DRAFT_1915289 [Cryptophyta sp. CCMP2293]